MSAKQSTQTFLATTARCQRKPARLYGSRAHIALEKVRQARDLGNATAVCSDVSEARFWRKYALDWLRKACRLEGVRP